MSDEISDEQPHQAGLLDFMDDDVVPEGGSRKSTAKPKTKAKPTATTSTATPKKKTEKEKEQPKEKPKEKKTEQPKEEKKEEKKKKKDGDELKRAGGKSEDAEAIDLNVTTRRSMESVSSSSSSSLSSLSTPPQSPPFVPVASPFSLSSTASPSRALIPPALSNDIDPDIARYRDLVGKSYFSNYTVEEMYITIEGRPRPPIPEEYKAYHHERPEKKKALSNEQKGGKGGGGEQKGGKARDPFINVCLWTQNDPTYWKGGRFWTPHFRVKRAILGFGNYHKTCGSDVKFATASLAEARYQILVHVAKEDYTGEYEKFWPDVEAYVHLRKLMNIRYYQLMVECNGHAYVDAARTALINAHQEAAANSFKSTKSTIEVMKANGIITDEAFKKQLQEEEKKYNTEMKWEPHSNQVAAQLRKLYGRGVVISNQDGEADVEVNGAFMKFEAPVTRNLSSYEVNALKGRALEIANPFERAHYEAGTRGDPPIHQLFNNIEWHDLALNDGQQEDIPFYERPMDPGAVVSLRVRLSNKASIPHKSLRLADVFDGVNAYQPGEYVKQEMKTLTTKHVKFNGARHTPSFISQQPGDEEQNRIDYQNYLNSLARGIMGGGGGGNSSNSSNNNGNKRMREIEDGRGGGGGGGSNRAARPGDDWVNDDESDSRYAPRRR